MDAASNADIVIAAVKPWLIEEVLEPLRLKRTQILVSLAAGICFDDLAHFVVSRKCRFSVLFPIPPLPNVPA